MYSIITVLTVFYTQLVHGFDHFNPFIIVVVNTAIAVIILFTFATKPAKLGTYCIYFIWTVLKSKMAATEAPEPREKRDGFHFVRSGLNLHANRRRFFTNCPHNASRNKMIGRHPPKEMHSLMNCYYVSP